MGNRDKKLLEKKKLLDSRIFGIFLEVNKEDIHHEVEQQAEGWNPARKG